MFIDFFRNDEGCSIIYKVDVPKILFKSTYQAGINKQQYMAFENYKSAGKLMHGLITSKGEQNY